MQFNYWKWPAGNAGNGISETRLHSNFSSHVYTFKITQYQKVWVHALIAVPPLLPNCNWEVSNKYIIMECFLSRG